MGKAAAAAVYPLGWFDAAMVRGEEGCVLGASCWCGLYVFFKIGIVHRDGRALFDQFLINYLF